MKKTILIAFILSFVCSVSFAESLSFKKDRGSSHEIGTSSSYACMDWLNTGYMVIKKDKTKASFANGYIKFNKKAKRNTYLYLPADTYCVGDQILFKKTFGGKPVRINYIDVR